MVDHNLNELESTILDMLQHIQYTNIQPQYCGWKIVNDKYVQLQQTLNLVQTQYWILSVVKAMLMGVDHAVRRSVPAPHKWF